MIDSAAPTRTRAFPIVDFGTNAVGVFAFGNMATGVVAVGNVARGVIAVGNLAMGAIAIGNVGFGIIAGAGATVGIGIFSAAGCVAIDVVRGAAGVFALTEESPWLAFVPVLLWFGVFFAPGRLRRQPRPEPPVGRASDLCDGRAERAWVRARAIELRGDVLSFEQAGRDATARVNAAGRDELIALGVTHEGEGHARAVDLDLEAVLVATDAAGGYRDAVRTERALEVRAVREVPPPSRPWNSAADAQLFWRGMWLMGAISGTALAIAGVATGSP